MMGRHLDRRTLLQLIGGVAVAGVPRMSGAAVDSGVIAGGGIIGANLAYRFAKRGASVTAVEPHVEPGRVAAAAHAELEGSVDPVRVTELLLERAKSAGARVSYPSAVTGLDERNGKLRAVKTTAGEIEADVLIVACGTDTPRVAALAGVRVPLKES